MKKIVLFILVFLISLVSVWAIEFTNSFDNLHKVKKVAGNLDELGWKMFITDDGSVYEIYGDGTVEVRKQPFFSFLQSLLSPQATLATTTERCLVGSGTSWDCIGGSVGQWCDSEEDIFSDWSSCKIERDKRRAGGTEGGGSSPPQGETDTPTTCTQIDKCSGNIRQYDAYFDTQANGCFYKTQDCSPASCIDGKCEAGTQCEAKFTGDRSCDGRNVIKTYQRTDCSTEQKSFDCGVNFICNPEKIGNDCLEFEGEATPTCSDSDGGVFFKKGTVTYTDKRGITTRQDDVCSQTESNVLQEWTCNIFNQPIQEKRDCTTFGRICNDGACVVGEEAGFVCSETDSGKDYDVKGTTDVVDNQGRHVSTGIDRCISSTRLQEFYCPSPDAIELKLSEIDCVCIDNACQPETEDVSSEENIPVGAPVGGDPSKLATNECFEGNTKRKIGDEFGSRCDPLNDKQRNQNFRKIQGARPF